ncbi:hypothetical protein NBH00_10925 [Paraconexibacter antarcticus]|uniref:DUF4267 domain-containing protein n=1 Tax=Paraconexibacter antarcticus TaxID=2949664 RepID=A0ABY5DXE1_9ACTN|nr:hypothetical protein [Paraconexibacter antarcticus]UTI66698.1 hypothetical protein NBH00_10925 [Paraconexibacter antarcticus]
MTTPRRTAAVVAVAGAIRAAAGVAALAAPRRLLRVVDAADPVPATVVLARALGAREIAMGGAVLAAARGTSRGQRAALLTGAAVDLSDLVTLGGLAGSGVSRRNVRVLRVGVALAVVVQLGGQAASS